MPDDELALLLGAIDSLNGSIANASNIVATDNLNRDNRKWQSQEAAKARTWSAKQAELAYQRQQEYYDQNLSMSARRRQYEEAGFNPALLVEGGAASAPSVPQASAAPTAGNPSSFFTPLQVFSVVEKLMDIKMKQAEVRNIDAETSHTNKETSWIDAYNTASIDSLKAGIDKVRSDIDVNESVVEKNIQDVQESISRVSVNESTVQVNGALIDLHGSQKVLNECKAATERLNAQTIKEMLPYIQARQEAEIALTNAKTEEARFSAEDKMYDANLKMLRGLVDAKLIDSSYYDSIIDQANWSAKVKKREYKWMPINDICHNMSMLMIGAGSIMSGVGGAASGLGRAALVGQSLKPRNPIGF